VERLPKVQKLNRIQIDGDRVLQEAGRVMQQYPGALAGMEALTGPETSRLPFLTRRRTELARDRDA